VQKIIEKFIREKPLTAFAVLPTVVLLIAGAVIAGSMKFIHMAMML
jgi:hypothetical protein|tara:strand:- start:773 stop:910 length:138 start_codon:yes stop_codon:yes gene_type:complete